MNERIKELAEQANLEFIYDPTETPMKVFVECYENELEKFAELIVRECARVAGTTDYLDGDEYNSGREWAGAEVLEHFGVEE